MLHSLLLSARRFPYFAIALMACGLLIGTGQASAQQDPQQSPPQSPKTEQVRPPATSSDQPNEAGVLPPPVDVVTLAGKIRHRGDHYVLNDSTVPHSIVLLNNPGLLKKYSGQDVLVTGPMNANGEMLVQVVDPVMADQDKR